MDAKCTHRLFIAGGVCAILWPILSQAYYALYPAAAGQYMVSTGGPAVFATRWAELGQRPAVIALEWSQVAIPLLLWPFLLALYRLLDQQGQPDLALIAAGLGALGMSSMVFSGTFHPALSHNLAQAYADAASEAEGAAILSVLFGLFNWYGGLNCLASLLYLSSVGLTGLAFILGRTWRLWGWAGLIAACLALPAKLPLGLRAPSNICWTGLAYGLWPLALGIGLLRYGLKGYGNWQSEPERAAAV